MGMNKIFFNTIKWRSVMAIVAIFCIVLSSCAVKASIKSQLDFQQTTGQKNLSSNKGNSFISSSALDCLDAFEAKAIHIMKPEGKFAGGSVAILAYCAFTLLFGFHFLKNRSSHPLYNGGQTVGSLPIFLQYRKLII